MDYDISVIIPTHHEGRMAHATLRSVFRSIQYAKDSGIRTEIIVVLDKPDSKTQKYFGQYKNSDIQFFSVAFEEPGLARNYGVHQASGRYIALLDADDLFGKSWLKAAFKKAETCGDASIYYPEYVVCFERESLLIRYKDHDPESSHLSKMIEHNCWNSVHFFTRKSLLLENPFIPVPLDSGFGFEDWHWYCEITAHHIPIRIVPDTCVFYRKKLKASRNIQQILKHAVMPPSRFFDPENFSSIMGSRIVENHIAKNKYYRTIAYHFFQTMKAVSFYLYRILQSCLRPLLNRYPRVSRFAAAIQNAIKEFFRTPEKQVIPEWLMGEWKSIHLIEPQLYPTKAVLKNTRTYHTPDSRLAGPYLNLYPLYGKDVSHVFLVPWLVKGGADLVAINYSALLAKQNLAKNIVMIATNDTDSPWKDKLAEEIRFIEFGKMYPFLSGEEQEKLLVRLLLQKGPRVIHNINSDLGYRIFVKYGNALKNRSKLFGSSFCLDMTPEENYDGYPIRYLPKCFDILEAVLSDNHAFVERLRKLFAFDENKLHVQYQPAPIVAKKKKFDPDILNKKYLDILWAGRLDRQKRPDILFSIAQKCEELKLPVKFHVYGTSLIDSNSDTKFLDTLNNLTYYGGFEGLTSLPGDSYDLFLYTSQWDGLPNVLLEAISIGLPVIASNVGGISELIHNEKTGYLIDPYNDVGAYLNVLKKLTVHRSMLPIMADNAYSIVAVQHSWDAFSESVKKMPGYCNL